GAGSYARALKRECSRLGVQHRVRFAGALQARELSELYATSLALLMPSRREGFGLAALEAMAHGTPPVVSSAGGLVEVVEDGRSGVVVRELSPESLAEVLERLLTSRELWERLSRGARERAEQFSWERTAREYSRIYSEVVQE
ncbi:MAG: glycosyltransferase family 4 protein, partial [Euryarchaeota archaeon]|nr:glycosyltransferase family 4 protein [Euryarchaeota archaeon]